MSDDVEVSNGKGFRVSSGLLTQVVVWIVAALLTYGAVNARVTVLEDRYDRLANDIREIKDDVKAIRRANP